MNDGLGGAGRLRSARRFLRREMVAVPITAASAAATHSEKSLNISHTRRGAREGRKERRAIGGPQAACQYITCRADAGIAACLAQSCGVYYTYKSWALPHKWRPRTRDLQMWRFLIFANSVQTPSSSVVAATGCAGLPCRVT